MCPAERLPCLGWLFRGKAEEQLTVQEVAVLMAWAECIYKMSLKMMFRKSKIRNLMVRKVLGDENCVSEMELSR